MHAAFSLCPPCSEHVPCTLSPPAALPSDNIRELKKQLGDFMTDFMKQQNMDTGEDGELSGKRCTQLSVAGSRAAPGRAFAALPQTFFTQASCNPTCSQWTCWRRWCRMQKARAPPSRCREGRRRWAARSASSRRRPRRDAVSLGAWVSSLAELLVHFSPAFSWLQPALLTLLAFPVSCCDLLPRCPLAAPLLGLPRA